MSLLALFFLHMLGDFVLQGDSLAKEKEGNPNKMLLHAGLYAAAFLPMLFLFSFESAFFPFFLIIISHFLIDYSKAQIEEKLKGKRSLLVFAVDQLLHLAFIAAAYYYYSLNLNNTLWWQGITAQKLASNILVYATFALLILNPTSAFIKKLFAFLPAEPASGPSLFGGDRMCLGKQDENANAGALIGKLERIILFLLVLLNQYGAIGFVLAAKSLARFKQLEDKGFAERYLIGTLASTAVAILAALAVKKLLQ